MVTVNQKDSWEWCTRFSRRIQVVRREGVGSKVPRELFYFETRQVLIVHRAITRRNVYVFATHTTTLITSIRTPPATANPTSNL